MVWVVWGRIKRPAKTHAKKTSAGAKSLKELSVGKHIAHMTRWHVDTALATMEEVITTRIIVKTVAGKLLTLYVEASLTIAELKMKVLTHETAPFVHIQWVSQP